MSNTKRPSLAPKHTRKTDEKREEALDQGIAFTDTDGARLTVQLRQVRGSHEAKLRGICGMSFMELLEAMSQTQSLDLVAAAVWFGRLVNGRDPGDYDALLDEVGYEFVDDANFDNPADDAAPPEA